VPRALALANPQAAQQCAGARGSKAPQRRRLVLQGLSRVLTTTAYATRLVSFTAEDEDEST